MTTTATRFWTDEELLALPKDGRKREVVNGEMFAMSPASFDHGDAISGIYGPLWAAVRAKRLGNLADGQTGFRLRTGDLYCPDIAFVSAKRVAEHRRKGNVFFDGAPDLAVEVLSPSDTLGVLEEKLAQFFAEGMRVAWVVHPRTRTIHVYHSPAHVSVVGMDGFLDGEDVVPGFRLAVADIFPQGE